MVSGPHPTVIEYEIQSSDIVVRWKVSYVYLAQSYVYRNVSYYCLYDNLSFTISYYYNYYLISLSKFLLLFHSHVGFIYCIQY